MTERVGAGGPAHSIPRVDVLGVGVSVVDLPAAVAEVARWIDEGTQHYVCVTGVHGVMESQRDPELRAIHNASGLTTPDGMPMVWSGRWAGAPISRVYGPDLMLAVCAESVRPGRGWRHYFYGGRPGVADQLAARLAARFPGLVVAGTWSPPFGDLSPADDAEETARIDAAAPDLVWVGLSTPKQERWMAQHVGRLRAPVLVGVGAAFDIHAGTVRQAPPWMRRSGLEWLYRLGAEPRRLWKRYLVNNPRFVARILASPPRLQQRSRPGRGRRTAP